MDRKLGLVLVVAFAIVFFMVLKGNNKPAIENFDPMIIEIKARLTKISPQFGQIPMKIGDKSYTEDKSVITLCVTDKNTGKYYDINTLMYVALHECAHTITKASGEQAHDEEFTNNFTHLLLRASDVGVYNPNLPIPPTYCGIVN